MKRKVPDNIADYLQGTLSEKELDAFNEDILEGRISIAEIEGYESDLREGVENYGGSNSPSVNMFAIAATALLSAGVTWFSMSTNSLSTDVQVNANVTYLETYRSSDQEQLPILTLTDTELLTLVVYPDFEKATSLRVHIEQAINASLPPAHMDASDNWQHIATQDAPVGTKDSLIVTIPPQVLTPGLHRIRVEARLGNPSEETSGSSYRFVVKE